MIKSLIQFLTLGGLILTGFGCGSDLKLSVRAAESEKNQPSTALVRKVELTYHNASGHEEMREGVPVIGLSQPVSVDSEKLKDLNTEAGGVFESRAYSSEGLLLLRGSKRLSSQEDEHVDIILDRDSTQASVFASTLLRKIKFFRGPGLGSLEREAQDLRTALEQGQCLELPDIWYDPDKANVPTLVLESAIKVPTLYYDAGTLAEDGEFQPWGDSRIQMSLSPTGDSMLELGANFYEGKITRGPIEFVIRLFTPDYEGCLKIKVKTETRPLEASTSLEPAAGIPFIIGLPRRAVAKAVIYNPNGFQVEIQFSGRARWNVNGIHPRFYYSLSNDDSPPNALTETRSIELNAQIPPHGSFGIFLFGISPNEFAHKSASTPHPFQFSWSATGTLNMNGMKTPLPRVSGFVSVP